MYRLLLRGAWRLTKVGAALVIALLFAQKLFEETGTHSWFWLILVNVYAFYYYSKELDSLRGRVVELEAYKLRQEWAAIDDD